MHQEKANSLFFPENPATREEDWPRETRRKSKGEVIVRFYNDHVIITVQYRFQNGVGDHLKSLLSHESIEVIFLSK